MKSLTCLSIVLLVSIAGCMNLKAPPPDVHEYRIDYPPPPETENPLPVILRISPFGTAAIYDRPGIVYRNGDYKTGTYFYDRWTAYPANMIADLLARDFAASGSYRAVQKGASTLPANYDLTAEVTAIEERNDDGNRSAHIAMRVTLARSRPSPGSRILFQKTYSATEPCSGKTTVELVSAMSRALAAISSRIRKDVHTAIEKEQHRYDRGEDANIH